MAKSINNQKVGNKTNRRLIGLGLAAALLLMVANSALWANSNLFNTERFSAISTAAITSDSSRQAIATSLTEQIFSGRPVALQLAGDTTTKLISGLLDTARFNNAIAGLTARLQTYVTSENQQSVVLNFEGFKDVIDNIIRLSGRDTEAIDTARIPDEIVVIDADNFPDYYQQGVVLLWLGPLALIGAALVLAYPYFKRLAPAKKTMAIQGTTVMFGGFLTLLIGPLFKPLFLANIESQHGRVVAANLYNGFIDTFNDQTTVIIVLGLLAVLVGGGWYLLENMKSRRSA